MTTKTMNTLQVTMKLHRHPDGQDLETDTLLVIMRMLYVSRRDTLELDLHARPPDLHLCVEVRLPSRKSSGPSRYKPEAQVHRSRHFAYQTPKNLPISDRGGRPS